MSHTKTGLFLPLMVVLGLAAAFGGNTLLDKAGDLLADLTNADPVIVEDNGYQLLVGRDGEAKVTLCTARVALTTRSCGDVKVIVIDAAKMAFIARNIKSA